MELLSWVWGELGGKRSEEEEELESEAESWGRSQALYEEGEAIVERGDCQAEVEAFSGEAGWVSEGEESDGSKEESNEEGGVTSPRRRSIDIATYALAELNEAVGDAKAARDRLWIEAIKQLLLETKLVKAGPELDEAILQCHRNLRRTHEQEVASSVDSSRKERPRVDRGSDDELGDGDVCADEREDGSPEGS